MNNPNISILAIGLDDKTDALLQLSLSHLPDTFPYRIDYLGNRTVKSAMNTVFDLPAADITVVDCDGRSGRMIWNTLKAHGNGQFRVCLSDDATSINAEYHLRKRFQTKQMLSLIETLAIRMQSQSPHDFIVPMFFAA